MIKEQPMASVGELWTSVYNVFDPWRMLWGDELERYFVEREGGLLETLAPQLSPDTLPQRVLLTGHHSSGISTELAKLGGQLARDFTVVYFDVFWSLGPDADYADLLFAIGVAIYKAADDLGLRLDHGPLKRLADNLCTVVRERTTHKGFEVDPLQWLGSIVAYGLGALGLPAPPLQAQGLSLGLEEEVTKRREIKPYIARVADGVNEIISELEAKSPDKPLLLLVDGLDKFPLERARSVLAESPMLSKLNCWAVYTAPIALRSEFSQLGRFFYTLPFPIIKLYEWGRRQEHYEPGYETMRSVVHERLKGIGLDPEDVITEEALNLLIAMSGGVMRDLILLMREASVSAKREGKPSIQLGEARKAVYFRRRQYAMGLRKPDYDELESFLASGKPEDAKVFDQLVENLYILIYVDETPWYDIHPNVLPLITGE
jgi:hypothetical protein